MKYIRTTAALFFVFAVTYSVDAQNRIAEKKTVDFESLTDFITCDLFDPDTKYGHDYKFYPVKKWHIIRRAELNNAGSSFSIKLRVRK